MGFNNKAAGGVLAGAPDCSRSAFPLLFDVSLEPCVHWGCGNRDGAR
jgi:hypothetical protein